MTTGKTPIAIVIYADTWLHYVEAKLTHSLPSFLMKSASMISRASCKLSRRNFSTFKFRGTHLRQWMPGWPVLWKLWCCLSAYQFVNLFTTASSSEVFARHNLHVSWEIIHADFTRKKNAFVHLLSFWHRVESRIWIDSSDLFFFCFYVPWWYLFAVRGPFCFHFLSFHLLRTSLRAYIHDLATAIKCWNFEVSAMRVISCTWL